MLTDLACRKATATGSEYRLADASGLYLLVTKAGHRSWRMGYWFAKRKKRLVLGSYPEMSLQQARDARDAARRLVAQGIDPAVDKKQKTAARLVQSNATLRVIAEAWLEEQTPRWNGKHAKNVREALERDILPHLGSVPIGAITKAMVAQRLKAIEARGAVETAKRHRQRLEEIYAYAEASGYEVANPALVNASLKPLVRRRWPAITDIEQLRRMLWTVEKAPAHPVTKLASRFLALTAARPGVVQTLPWDELPDLDAADPLWTVPADRMKLSVERKKQEAFDHVVPLARQSVELLRALRVMTGHGPLAFPSSLSMRRAMSDSTLSKLYRDNGFRGRHVPHGWRSSFSTIMNERAMAAERPGDRVIIDMMLGHVQAGVEPIYNRSAYLPRRRELAQEWADLLLDGLPPASTLLTGARR